MADLNKAERFCCGAACKGLGLHRGCHAVCETQTSVTEFCHWCPSIIGPQVADVLHKH